MAYPGTLLTERGVARSGLEHRLRRFVEVNSLEPRGWTDSNTDGVVAADPVLATHNAMFELWFPLDHLAIAPSKKAELAPIASEVRAGMYTAFEQSSALFALLKLWTAPSSLPFYDALKESKDEAIVAFITQAGGFGSLDFSQTMRVFSLCFSETFGPLATQFAMVLREAYLSNIYDLSLALPITQIQPPKVFVDDMPTWVKQHSPSIAPSRLRYDASTGTITHTDGPIDYLVVGSGPAGSTLARGLQVGGKRVVLLERGPFVIWGSMATMSYPNLMFEGNQSTTDNNSIAFRAGQTLGGGTTVNIDLCFEPSMPSVREHIDEWIASGRILGQYYTPEAIKEAYATVVEYCQPYQVTPNLMNRDNGVLWNGALANGIKPSFYMLNRYQPGTSPSPVDDKHDAAVTMLYPAIGDTENPLSVLPNALANSVIMEDGRATGVSFTQVAPWDTYGNTIDDPCGLNIPVGATASIAAENVILSAGTLGTTRLLRLTSSKYPELATPNIGRGVVVHPSFPLVGRFDQPIDMLQGLDSGVYVDQAVQYDFFLEAMTGLPAYGALLIPGSGIDVYNTIAQFNDCAGFGVALIDSSSMDNLVDVDDVGNPTMTYNLTDADRANFVRGAETAVKVMFGGGAQSVIIPTCENVLGLKDFDPMVATPLTDPSQAALVAANLKFTPNRAIVTAAHLQAANKIGPFELGAVVSPRHRVWRTDGSEVPNLLAMDSSIFPTSAGANPMQTIYTFAQILVQRILTGDLSSSD